VRLQRLAGYVPGEDCVFVDGWERRVNCRKRAVCCRVRGLGGRVGERKGAVVDYSNASDCSKCSECFREQMC
jgi:hypothetical protein